MRKLGSRLTAGHDAVPFDARCRDRVASGDLAGLAQPDWRQDGSAKFNLPPAIDFTFNSTFLCGWDHQGQPATGRDRHGAQAAPPSRPRLSPHRWQPQPPAGPERLYRGGASSGNSVEAIHMARALCKGKLRRGWDRHPLEAAAGHVRAGSRPSPADAISAIRLISLALPGITSMALRFAS